MELNRTMGRRRRGISSIPGTVRVEAPGAAVMALVLAFASTSSAQCRYSVEILQADPCPFPVSGSPLTVGTGLNSAGWVVGSHQQCYPNPPTNGHAWLWTGDGPLTQLPLFPGYVAAGAEDISNTGMIVGSQGHDFVGKSGGVAHYPVAAYWLDGEPHLIGPTRKGDWSEAVAVNDEGDAVGYWRNNLLDIDRRAFVWRDGEFIDLGTISGPQSALNDINDNGIAVGWTGLPTQDQAFQWYDGEIEFLATIPGTIYSTATSVNDKNDIAGGLRVVDPRTGSIHGQGVIWWHDGRIELLPALTGYNCGPQDINNDGAAVGLCISQSNVNDRRAVIYLNGAVTDLNDLVDLEGVGMLQSPVVINDAGQILARAPSSTGTLSVLLTPEPASVTDLTGDCRTDSSDLQVLLQGWGAASSPADFNHDGTVNAYDLALLLGHWG